jgi:iron complex transport system substrate-binding protein
MLFEIGAGHEVVGVTHECDYPAAALQLPKLTSSALPEASTSKEIDRHVRASVHGGSSLYHLDAELLETLKPDLIITQELCPVCAVSYETVTSAAKRLRTDPRIVSLEPSSLADVLANIGFVGETTGHAWRARALVESLTSRIEVLRRQGRGVPQPRTLVLEWTDPPMSAGHWTPELVELAGGVPVLAHPGSNSQRLEWSAISAAEPDAIVVAPCGFDIARTRRAIEELDRVDAWNALRATREGRVLAMDGSAYVNRPGPRLIDSAEIIAEWYTTLAEDAG